MNQVEGVAADRAGWMEVCTLDESAARSILPFRMDGRQLILVRSGRDLFACERACPHEQADLATGRCAAGRLSCPRHRASFDLAGGAISPGWQARRLHRHAVRVADDRVFVALAPL